MFQMRGEGEKIQQKRCMNGLWVPLSVGKMRWMKPFAYGFVTAFVGYTAFLAFNPSGNGSPWFNSLFSSSSISTSITPYRSHFNNLISHFFPNSTSSSSPALNSNPFDGGNVGSHKYGVLPIWAPKGDVSVDGLPGGGLLSKNRTESEPKSLKDGSLVQQSTDGRTELQANGAGSGNAVDGADLKKNTFMVEMNTSRSQTLATNHTADGLGGSSSGDAGKAFKKEINSGPQVNGAQLQNATPALLGTQSVNQTASSVTAQNDMTKASAGAQPNNQRGALAANSGSSVNTGAPAPNKDVGQESVSQNQKTLSYTNQSRNQSTALSGARPLNKTAVAARNPGSSDKKGAPAPKEDAGRAKASQNQTGSSTASQSEKQTTVSSGVTPKNQTAATGGNVISEKKGAPTSKEAVGGITTSEFTASLRKSNSSTTQASSTPIKRMDDWVKGMANCDIFHGKWLHDDSYPLYSEGSCPHIDEPFDCYHNGRPDRAYQKLRWQPDGCKIPRFNALDLLERLRGKRLVFVGDSLNRNMWESLVCVLRNSVMDKKKVFEASGRHKFRTEGSYSFLFTDYNCSVEFFRSPFLVQEWEVSDPNGKKKETLRLDIVEKSSSRYKDAHIIVFNSGHWWTHEKTSMGKDYYQEGNRIYSELNVVEAFHKALHTWSKWVDTNVNPKKTLVFFRGYSASHFSGGRWNSGGACDKETEPIKNEKYLLSYPPLMRVLEMVLNNMKTPVSFLNITRMTDFRKDAHPSIYRKQSMTDEERRAPERFQDCSHWCLPGVPDSWNELLYAQILIKQHQTPSW
ncbi:hypothetical protein HPP92_018750 [Vanilla planifolia]|uniref:Trichome birefringence-like N-terminal domain-containing protein n=1 Tax=Vanilla planifolia TaxID=51239 RepID=A0A835Q1N6_VANPL|nr:hypothetical protein HPP92_018750 [Vanilla planifolia]